MGRGIDRTKIFRSKTDREGLLERLGGLCEVEAFVVYVWALMQTLYVELNIKDASKIAFSTPPPKAAFGRNQRDGWVRTGKKMYVNRRDPLVLRD
jgi:hypothetical protein